MMKDVTVICKDELRRHQVRKKNLNGLDYLEVLDDQYTLMVYFLNDLDEASSERISKNNIVIKGGRRITGIEVEYVDFCLYTDPERDDCMLVMVDEPGDFSTYTLCLVEVNEQGRPTDQPLQGFDPRYACLPFIFKVGCPGDLDCLAPPICPPTPLPQPEINYLAKDYASFRQLILDRLALIMPDWRERHVPDIGIALVEVLAYVGDHLTYYQDAIATEAYLDTARQRISIRRHARLVDYQMHEGCNARAWVCVTTEDPVLELDPDKIYFVTAGDLPRLGKSGIVKEEDLSAGQYEVFEPLLEPKLEFRPSDFKDLAGLVAKLRPPQQQNPVSRYIWGRLSLETREKLTQYDGSEQLSEELRRALVDELNCLLHDTNLYARWRFAQVERPPRRNLQGPELLRSNRLLLEAAYPGEIASSQKIYLYAGHSEIAFYTWGDRQCCLPRGATAATLAGQWAFAPGAAPPQASQAAVQREPVPDPDSSDDTSPAPTLYLQVGDILVFEEVIGPKTGNPADANPARRHAVRLTHVEPGMDELYGQPIVEIEWAEEDALPFPLCVSAIGPAPYCEFIGNISVARGNVILVDHGQRGKAEDVGTVPGQERVFQCLGQEQAREATVVPARFRPHLQKEPLVFSQPLSINAPATAMPGQDPRQALPAVEPLGAQHGVETRWLPQRDLLNSYSSDNHFVVEVDNAGQAHLRFGDGELGRRPAAGAQFTATYRVGGGPAGNVGPEAISHLVLRPGYVVDCGAFELRNPLPAQGGVSPEPIAEVKQFASHAFRTQLQRAIVAEDYAQLAELHPKVQRARATLRWAGSWYEMLVVIDPLGQAEADPDLLDEIAGYLYPYHRIGHDVAVASARYVPLDISMTICVKPGYLRGHVKAALMARFSNRVLPGGQLGFFHPDNLTFGDGIALSKLVAVAQAVPGVESVAVTRLQRLDEEPNDELDTGILPLGPLEAARLDNDPSFPEHGKLELIMEGER